MAKRDKAEVKKDVRSPNTQKIGIRLVFGWIIGTFTILLSLGAMVTSLAGGIFVLAAGLLILPPFNGFLKSRYNIELSGWLKLIVFIILFGIGMNLSQSASPTTKNHAGTVSGIETVSSPVSTQILVPTATSMAASTANQFPYYKFGDKVVVGNFAYTFLSKQIQSRIVAPLSSPMKEADGIFMIFDIEIENVGKETENLWSLPIKVVDEQGRTYEHNVEAEFYLRTLYPQDKGFVFGDSLQPGLPRGSKIVFDVPTGLPQNPKALIELSKEGLFSSEKKYVSWQGQ